MAKDVNQCGAGSFLEFDAAHGRTWVERVTLSPREMIDLVPLFPDMATRLESVFGEDIAIMKKYTAGTWSAIDKGEVAMLQVMPLEAKRVLTRKVRFFATLLTVLPVVTLILGVIASFMLAFLLCAPQERLNHVG